MKRLLLLFLLSQSTMAFPVIDVANLHQNIIQVKLRIPADMIADSCPS